MANKTLLQMKYARIISLFTKKKNLNEFVALDFFYNSSTYKFMSGQISDFHCMSDLYLVDELIKEYNNEKTSLKSP